MKKFSWCIFSAVAFFLIVFSLQHAWSAELTPCEVVLKYYHALQKKDFQGASQCISRNMLKDKTEAQWVETMKNMFEGGKVEITDVSATPGPISGQEAQVKSIVNSRDAFNADGIIEHNREYLVKENGVWKLDKTELEE